MVLDTSRRPHSVFLCVLIAAMCELTTFEEIGHQSASKEPPTIDIYFNIYIALFLMQGP